MLFGAHSGSLELRSAGGEIHLRASFPYNAVATLSDGGRTGRARQEVFAARAFGEHLDRGEDVHFLFAHDFNKPLAARSAGTLTLTDTDAALSIEATIDPKTTWAQDFLHAREAGLIQGLSPGFRVRPGGETVEARGEAILRTVTAASLIEVSAVTRPAYPDAQIEARNWRPVGEAMAQPAARHAAYRWR